MVLRDATLMAVKLCGDDLSGATLAGGRFTGPYLRNTSRRGARCRGTRFGTCQLNFADFRGADLTDAALETAESIQGADFSLSLGMAAQAEALLTRNHQELDCWNPITRNHTRSTLETLRATGSKL